MQKNLRVEKSDENDNFQDDPNVDPYAEEGEAESAQIAGANLLNYDNARLRCDFKEVSQRNYEVTCRLVAVSANGDEFFVAKKERDLVISWLPAEVKAGTVVNITDNCHSNDSQFRRTWCVETSSPTAELKFKTGFSKPSKPPRSEDSTVLLPLYIMNYGEVGAVPFNYHPDNLTNEGSFALTEGEPKATLSGFENHKLGKIPVTFFQRSRLLCERDDGIYLASLNTIYRSSGGDLYHWAGSYNTANIDDKFHRTRRYFYNYHSACGKDGIYVAGGQSIVRMRDDGFTETLPTETSDARRNPNFVRVWIIDQGLYSMVSNHGLIVRLNQTTGKWDTVFDMTTALAGIDWGSIIQPANTDLIEIGNNKLLFFFNGGIVALDKNFNKLAHKSFAAVEETYTVNQDNDKFNLLSILDNGHQMMNPYYDKQLDSVFYLCRSKQTLKYEFCRTRFDGNQITMEVDLSQRFIQSNSRYYNKDGKIFDVEYSTGKIVSIARKGSTTWDTEPTVIADYRYSTISDYRNNEESKSLIDENGLHLGEIGSLEIDDLGFVYIYAMKKVLRFDGKLTVPQKYPEHWLGGTPNTDNGGVQVNAAFDFPYLEELHQIASIDHKNAYILRVTGNVFSEELFVELVKDDENVRTINTEIHMSKGDQDCDEEYSNERNQLYIYNHTLYFTYRECLIKATLNADHTVASIEKIGEDPSFRAATDLHVFDSSKFLFAKESFNGDSLRFSRFEKISTTFNKVESFTSPPAGDPSKFDLGDVPGLGQLTFNITIPDDDTVYMVQESKVYKLSKNQPPVAVFGANSGDCGIGSFRGRNLGGDGQSQLRANLNLVCAGRVIDYKQKIVGDLEITAIIQKFGFEYNLVIVKRDL